MGKRELSREERWEWLRKTTWGKGTIPWDRMALPHHEWMDEVQILETYEYNSPVSEIVNVPRYKEDLTKEMQEHLALFHQYREERKNNPPDEDLIKQLR